MSGRSYLDHNATTPLRPEAAAALVAASGFVGNPSSVHAEGRAARALIETAREQVAALVGARARDVVFTGGGSEANATVLNPGLRRHRDTRTQARLFVSAGEHASVLDGHRFTDETVRLPLGSGGTLEMARLEAELAALDPAQVRAVVAVQMANNETGIVQPLPDIAARVHASGGIVVADAVQAAGRIPVDLSGLCVDALTLSAHKIGGPKGVGAIVLTPDIELGERLIGGGGQELNRRAGTENVAGIAAFGAAAEAAQAVLEAEARRLAVLRDAFEAGLRRIAPDVVIFGEAAPRLPNTSLVALPGARAETLLMAFDLDGIAVSSGSACSSGKVRPSHVLAAMGVPEDLSAAAVRVSLGWTTTENDIERCLAAFAKAARTLSERRFQAA